MGVVEKSNQVNIYCCLLAKAEKNLRAGKQILDIGGINILSDMDLLTSIYEYNLFSDDFYLRINNYDYDYEDEEQDYDEICQQLYQDVREDNGIDIVTYIFCLVRRLMVIFSAVLLITGSFMYKFQFQAN